ncbi:hypothetical protein LV564_01320 [Komagataeibacter nataicola]|uniref:hypothetical protein n=1 Tax=Komagataeibacter nataicola TaxID=265960 RepID=UPI0023DD32B4|nr:hypothetical protein [Komagataeibacter nataicola]WEQ55783.1 hypothetical protein LV564_01320 [Komagataeibacter nataicola]
MTEKSQKDRFIEAAKKLEANENEASFKKKLGQIARQKPKDPAPSTSDQSRKGKK